MYLDYECRCYTGHVSDPSPSCEPAMKIDIDIPPHLFYLEFFVSDFSFFGELFRELGNRAYNRFCFIDVAKQHSLKVMSTEVLSHDNITSATLAARLVVVIKEISSYCYSSTLLLLAKLMPIAICTHMFTILQADTEIHTYLLLFANVILICEIDYANP